MPFNSETAKETGKNSKRGKAKCITSAKSELVITLI